MGCANSSNKPKINDQIEKCETINNNTELHTQKTDASANVQRTDLVKYCDECQMAYLFRHCCECKKNYGDEGFYKIEHCCDCNVNWNTQFKHCCKCGMETYFTETHCCECKLNYEYFNASTTLYDTEKNHCCKCKKVFKKKDIHKCKNT